MNCPDCLIQNAEYNLSLLTSREIRAGLKAPVTNAMSAVPVEVEMEFVYDNGVHWWVCPMCGLRLLARSNGALVRSWRAPAASPHSNHVGERKGGHKAATA